MWDDVCLIPGLLTTDISEPHLINGSHHHLLWQVFETLATHSRLAALLGLSWCLPLCKFLLLVVTSLELQLPQFHFWSNHDVRMLFFPRELMVEWLVDVQVFYAAHT